MAKGNVMKKINESQKTNHPLLWKFSLHPANILFGYFSVSNLLFHFSSLFRASSEQKQAGCESIQAMNGPKVFQLMFFGQDEDNGIVPISSAWVDLGMKLVQLYSLCLV
jgi:hypothetical protein